MLNIGWNTLWICSSSCSSDPCCIYQSFFSYIDSLGHRCFMLSRSNIVETLCTTKNIACDHVPRPLSVVYSVSNLGKRWPIRSWLGIVRGFVCIELVPGLYAAFWNIWFYILNGTLNCISKCNKPMLLLLLQVCTNFNWLVNWWFWRSPGLQGNKRYSW